MSTIDLGLLEDVALEDDIFSTEDEDVKPEMLDRDNEEDNLDVKEIKIAAGEEKEEKEETGISVDDLKSVYNSESDIHSNIFRRKIKNTGNKTMASLLGMIAEAKERELLGAALTVDEDLETAPDNETLDKRAATCVSDIDVITAKQNKPFVRKAINYEDLNRIYENNIRRFANAYKDSNPVIVYPRIPTEEEVDSILNRDFSNEYLQTVSQKVIYANEELKPEDGFKHGLRFEDPILNTLEELMPEDPLFLYMIEQPYDTELNDYVSVAETEFTIFDSMEE